MNGPACDPRWPGGHKGVLVGPTHGDCVAAQVKGATGLMAHNKEIRLINRKDGTFVHWPNGSEAVVLGMHSEKDADRLRANAANACCWWIDEAAIGNHLKTAIDNLRFGARLPAGRPHGIATTTPKPTAQYREFTRMPGVVVTKASSYSNRYLTDEHKEIIAIYEGTRLGAQEIHGDLIDAYEGALWSLDTLNDDRVKDPAILALSPEEKLAALGIVKVGVGIDPSTWIPEIGAPPEDDDYASGAGVETGIVTVGIDRRNPPHVYVFADSSGRVAAVEWARRATNDYHTWRAAWIVPETNAGGDMVLATIHLTDSTVAIYREPDSKKPGVRAAVGKRARAEPVALLSDQHRFHMVGTFVELESTLTGWDPTLAWSPDRLDALVWPVTALRPWRKRGTSGAGGRGLVRA
jgi:phage terminase large subunit-like protein